MSASSLHKHLVFRVGKQLLCASLNDIIEVVEPYEAAASPNSPKEFLGMINLRGEIISVVDSRVLLGQDQVKQPKMLMIIVSTKNGKVAMLVDELVEVHDFQSEDLDLQPNLKSDLPKESLLGVGKFKSNVVYVVVLPVLLGDTKFKEAV